MKMIKKSTSFSDALFFAVFLSILLRCHFNNLWLSPRNQSFRNDAHSEADDVIEIIHREASASKISETPYSRDDESAE